MQTMTWSRFTGECAIAVLALVLSLAAPAWAQPQPLPQPQLPQTLVPDGFFCIDPMASGARRTWQAEPCKLPLVAWPLLVEVNPDEPKRAPTFEREASAEQGGHEHFWRLPWRGYPPHSARSATFWR